MLYIMFLFVSTCKSQESIKCSAVSLELLGNYRGSYSVNSQVRRRFQRKLFCCFHSDGRQKQGKLFCCFLTVGRQFQGKLFSYFPRGCGKFLWKLFCCFFRIGRQFQGQLFCCSFSGQFQGKLSCYFLKCWWTISGEAILLLLQNWLAISGKANMLLPQS